jgi:hypothetical protein
MIIIVFSFILISFVMGIDYNESIYGFLTDGSDVLHLYNCPPGYKFSKEMMKCIVS